MSGRVSHSCTRLHRLLLPCINGVSPLIINNHVLLRLVTFQHALSIVLDAHGRWLNTPRRVVRCTCGHFELLCSMIHVLSFSVTSLPYRGTDKLCRVPFPTTVTTAVDGMRGPTLLRFQHNVAMT